MLGEERDTHRPLLLLLLTHARILRADERDLTRNCFFYSTITVRPAFLLHRSGGIAREIRISRTLPPFGAIDSSIDRN